MKSLMKCKAMKLVLVVAMMFSFNAANAAPNAAPNQTDLCLALSKTYTAVIMGRDEGWPFEKALDTLLPILRGIGVPDQVANSIVTTVYGNQSYNKTDVLKFYDTCINKEGFPKQ